MLVTSHMRAVWLHAEPFQRQPALIDNVFISRFIYKSLYIKVCVGCPVCAALTNPKACAGVHALVEEKVLQGTNKAAASLPCSDD